MQLNVWWFTCIVTSEAHWDSLKYHWKRYRDSFSSTEWTVSQVWVGGGEDGALPFSVQISTSHWGVTRRGSMGWESEDLSSSANDVGFHWYHPRQVTHAWYSVSLIVKGDLPCLPHKICVLHVSSYDALWSQSQTATQMSKIVSESLHILLYLLFPFSHQDNYLLSNHSLLGLNKDFKIASFASLLWVVRFLRSLALEIFHEHQSCCCREWRAWNGGNQVVWMTVFPDRKKHWLE